MIGVLDFDLPEMAKWVKDQTDESQTPITSHRAFFRERANFPLFDSLAIRSRRPRHPCAQYATWKEYSFTSTRDWEHDIVISNWGGQHLVTVDGYPRTVVSSWKNMDGFDVDIGTGTSGFCK